MHIAHIALKKTLKGLLLMRASREERCVAAASRPNASTCNLILHLPGFEIFCLLRRRQNNAEFDNLFPPEIVTERCFLPKGRNRNGE